MQQSTVLLLQPAQLLFCCLDVGHVRLYDHKVQQVSDDVTQPEHIHLVPHALRPGQVAIGLPRMLPWRLNSHSPTPAMCVSAYSVFACQGCEHILFGSLRKGKQGADFGSSKR